ncbi:MAG: ribosomal RNA small subunit methyltransferase A [Spirochaetales bacterium]|nr:ribosomal RNA small subunit methyltransferase A [Spirochaetales bacterium]
MNYESKNEIRQVLETHGITVKKRWGQNFLVNRHAREQIVSMLECKKTDSVWEIGPGLGALTSLLIPAVRQLIVFEIDHGMIRALTAVLGGDAPVVVRDGDAVKRFEDTAKELGTPCRIIGNLPYSSASKIIAKLIELELFPEKMVFTVQKELALRMTAKPGTKNYSSFSVFCQAWFAIHIETDLKGGSFFPEPDVVSSVIAMTPDKKLAAKEEELLFSEIIRTGFASRRKMLIKNLSGIAGFSDEKKRMVKEFLKNAGKTESARAEELSVLEYIKLVRLLLEGR